MFTMRQKSTNHFFSLFSHTADIRMSFEIAGPPTTQHIRVYDEHERGAIDPFKKEYLDATTPSTRKTVAQLKIFPALFQYWESIGKKINDAKRKELSKVYFTLQSE